MDRRSWLPKDMRAYHRGLLLRLLTERGPLTRRELSLTSGLSVPTVASIVADLVHAGHVHESVPSWNGTRPRGPRATRISVAKHSHAVLSVDVCANRLRVGVCDLSGVVSEAVSSVRVQPGASAESVLELAVEAARPLVEAAGDRLLGIGVGVPGPVDAEGRRSVLSLPLGWQDVPVAECFEDAFAVPAVVEYNVRAMCVAEARYGLGVQAENLLYVHLGESFGIAFAVDGRPFRQGAHGVSELGHRRVVEDGPRCACGAVGCLEAVLGEGYLRRRVREAAVESRTLAALARRRLPVLSLLDTAARAGEPAAVAILDDVVTHLSTAIALSVDLLTPARVALGGELATAPDELLARLVDATLEGTSKVLRDRVRIERSAIGRYPGLLGAGTVALDRLFYRDQPPLSRGPATRPAKR